MSEAASATVSGTLAGGAYQYSATLNDTGTTTIGTFWFAWVPGEDFLDVSPTNIVTPAGWTAIVTHVGAGDGYAIQYKATAAASYLQPGASLSGFGFTSTETPAQLAGNSPFFPTTPETTSFVYSGAPFSDPGFDLTAAVSVTQSNANISVPAGAVETVNGDDDLIIVGDGATLTVNGFGDTIDQSSGFVTIGGTGAGFDVLSGSHLEVTLLADADLFLAGSVNDVHLGANSVVDDTGDNTNFFGSDDTIRTRQATVGGDSVTGDSNRIFVAPGSQLILDGNNNFMRAGVNSSMAATGANERVFGAGFFLTATAGSDLLIGRNGATGAADTLTASNITARIAADSNIILSGDDDTVSAREGAHVDFVGTGLTARFGDGASVVISGEGLTGPLDTLSGADFSVNVATSADVKLSTLGATVTLVDNVALTLERANNKITAGNADTINILWGDFNTVLLGQNDVVSDGGSGTTFQASGNVGATTINNFSADPGGVVELLNGVGGYATSADAFNALTSDGASGSVLSLGANGSIDFAGDTALSAGNFKIG